jgi:hypothetical protein
MPSTLPLYRVQTWRPCWGAIAWCLGRARKARPSDRVTAGW